MWLEYCRFCTDDKTPTVESIIITKYCTQTAYTSIRPTGTCTEYYTESFHSFKSLPKFIFPLGCHIAVSLILSDFILWMYSFRFSLNCSVMCEILSCLIISPFILQYKMLYLIALCIKHISITRKLLWLIFITLPMTNHCHIILV